MASTVTVVVASVAETTPRAVTVTGPTAKFCGTSTVVVISPAAFDVTVIGSRPGKVTVTLSLGAKPVPEISVLVPPGTVAGSAVIVGV